MRVALPPPVGLACRCQACRLRYRQCRLDQNRSRRASPSLARRRWRRTSENGCQSAAARTRTASGSPPRESIMIRPSTLPVIGCVILTHPQMINGWPAFHIDRATGNPNRRRLNDRLGRQLALRNCVSASYIGHRADARDKAQLNFRRDARLMLLKVPPSMPKRCVEIFKISSWH